MVTTPHTIQTNSPLHQPPSAYIGTNSVITNSGVRRMQKEAKRLSRVVAGMPGFRTGHECWRGQLSELRPVAERLGVAVTHQLQHGTPGVGGIGQHPRPSGHELVGRRQQRPAVIDDAVHHGLNVRVGDA